VKVPPVCWDGLAYYSWLKFCFIGKKTPLEHFLLYKHKSFPFVGPFCCAPMFTNEISVHLSTDVGFEPNLLNSCACYLFFSFSILMARYITFRTFVQAYFFFKKKNTSRCCIWCWIEPRESNKTWLSLFFLFLCNLHGPN
jgi:hypothetical protein